MLISSTQVRPGQEQAETLPTKFVVGPPIAVSNPSSVFGWGELWFATCTQYRTPSVLAGMLMRTTAEVTPCGTALREHLLSTIVDGGAVDC